MTQNTISLSGNNNQDHVRLNVQEGGQNEGDDEGAIGIRIDLGGGYSKYVNLSPIDRQKLEAGYEALKTGLRLRNNEDVHFSVVTMSVSWINDAGDVETQGLEEGIVGNQELLEKARELQGIVKKYCPHLLFPDITSDEKLKELRGRNSFSETPALRRNHEVLQKLPTEFKPCAKQALEIYSQAGHQSDADIDNALKRIAVRERAIKEHLKLVKEEQNEIVQKLIAAGTELQTAADDQTKRRAKDKQKGFEEDLKKLQAFSQFERLGLYVAAAFTPEIDEALTEAQKLDLASDAAEKAFEALASTLVEETRRGQAWMPDLVRGAAQLAPELKEYSADAAALIFNVLPPALARKGIRQFYEKHALVPKAHSLEADAMRLAHKNDGYTGKQHPEMRLMKKKLTGGRAGEFATKNTEAQVSIGHINGRQLSAHLPAGYLEKVGAFFTGGNAIEEKIAELDHVYRLSQ
jgi:hypothetical protein